MRDGLELRSSMKHLATDTFWRAVTRALLGSLVLAVLTAICYRMQVASISRPVYSVALTSGEPLVAEARALRADGEYRWLVIRAVPLRDERGNIIKWYGTDIEDEKRAGEALQRAQVELAHVTRVTTLGELAASIAHEINQPLAAIVTDANACLHWLNAHGPLLQSCAKR